MATGSPAGLDNAAALARISALPQGRRMGALVGLLAERIERMDTATLHRKRGALVEHFASCGSSHETVALIAEWIDCQLALRRVPRGRRLRRAA
jgi:hypothetical protein